MSYATLAKVKSLFSYNDVGEVNANNVRGKTRTIKRPPLPKAVSMLLVFIALLAFAGSVSSSFRVQGDFPDTGLNYRIEAYNTAQTNMCDGAADNAGEIMYFSSAYTTGDNQYNDNDDFNEFYSGTLGGPTTVYFYFCGPGGNAAAKIVEFTKTVNDGDDLEIDLGYVNGTANVHNDLVNDYVAVCDNLNGNKLSSENKQTDGTTGEYTQYYYIDKGQIANSGDDPSAVYVLFDNDSTNQCAWDSTKSTGKKIDLTAALPDNYGVYVTFEPDTKVQGDLHADLDDAKIEVYNANDISVGMAHQGGTVPDGLTGGDLDNDYTLYYDQPTAGDLKIVITPASTSPATGHATTVTGIDRTIFASGDYDFINDIEDGTNGVPTDITEVKTSLTINSDAVTISTTPVTSGSVKRYDMFVDLGSATQSIDFYVGTTKVLTVTRDISTEGDEGIDVGKVSGEAHSNIESGSDDPITVYNDSSCTNLLSSETVNPSDNNTGVDFTQYFEDDGSGTFYMKISKDNTYNTCGNSFTLTNQTATRNLDVQVYGLVPAAIDQIGIDRDNDNVVTGTAEASTVPITGTYYLYTDSSVTGASTDEVLFFDGGNLELQRGKDLTTDQNVHVAEVKGDTHTNVNDGGDDLRVFGDETCTTTELSSEAEAPTAADTPDYIQYYESSGSQAYYAKVSAVVGTYTYVSCVRFAGSGNGQSDTVDITVQMNGEVPTGVATVAVDLDEDGTYDARTSTIRGADPDLNYFLYMVPDSDTSADANFLDSSNNVLLSRQAVLNADETIHVARVRGDVHANLQGGNDSVEICNSIACTTKYSSETVNPTAGAGADDDYYVYYEVAAGGSTDIFLHITDVDTTTYSAFADVDVLNGGAVMPGDTDILDLTQLLSGTTVSEIDYIWTDDTAGAEDGTWEFAADTNGTSYRLYHKYTTSTTRNIKADEDSSESNGINLELSKDLSTTTTFNIDAIRGAVPSDFQGGTFEVENAGNGDDACGGALYGANGGTATIPADVSLQVYDYHLYVEADGTQYTVLACDSTSTLLLKRSKTVSNSGGNYYDVNIAKISGNVHTDLSNAADGADDIQVYADADCSTAPLSSQAEQPDTTATPHYKQFYEVSGAGTYYAKVTMNNGNPYVSCVEFTASGDGSADTLNFTRRLNGTVVADVTKIYINTNNDANTTTFNSGVYYIYTSNGTTSDTVYALNGTTILLQRTKDLTTDSTFNVAKVTGSAHADLQETDAADNIEVYNSGINGCSTLLSSENITIGTTYTQYFEPDATGNVFIKVIESDSTNTYETCIDTGVADPGAGGSVSYNVTRKVSGNVASGITRVVIDWDGGGTDDAQATVVTATTPDSYKAYGPGGGTSDIDFYNGTTLELALTGKDTSTADVTFNVGKVAGEVHTDAEQGGDDLITVWNDSACNTNQLSSENEAAADNTGGADYTQYFWDDGSGTFYVKLNKDGTYPTCTKGGITLTNQENTSVNFDREIRGTIPNISSANTSTHIRSIGANIDGTAGDEALAQSSGTQYYLFVDSTLAGVGDTITMYSDTAGTTALLSKTKDLSNDVTFNASVAYGEANTNLEGGSDTIKVCSDFPSATNWSTCTEASSLAVNPTDNVGGNDYELFFEQLSGTTTYYLQIKDVEGANNYYSYHYLNSPASGSEVNVNVDGRLYGEVYEDYNNSIKISDVNVEVFDNTHTSFITSTYTLNDGTYRIYSDSTTTRDLRFRKIGYITQDWSTDAANLNDQTLATGAGTQLNRGLITGIRVTLQDSGGNPINDATVKVLTSVEPNEQVLTGCTNPNGNCVRTQAVNNNGLYTFGGFDTTNPVNVKIKVMKDGFQSIIDPVQPTVFYSVDSSNGVNKTYTMIDAAPGPVALKSPADGATLNNATGSITLEWFDYGVDEVKYQVQVDDDASFASPVIDQNTADGDTTSYTITANTLTDGTTYYWRVRAYDTQNIGEWSSVRSFTVDNTAPSSLTVTIDGGAQYTTDRAVVLTVSATGATYCAFSNDNTNYTGWLPYGTQYDWDLSAGDGTKTVYMKCKDDAGNIAGAVSDTITLDTIEPAVVMELNGGSTYTTSTSVTLSYNAPDGASCDYSTDNGSSWTSLSSCSGSTSITVPTGDGLKEVVVRAVDAAGNYGYGYDSIILDTAAPGAPGSLSAAIVNEGIKLTWTAASDATSGVAYYNIYRDTTSGFTPSASNRIASGVTQTEFVDYPADGTYYYKVTAVDNAGQEGSASTEASATLDTTAPVDLAVTINDNALYTTSATVDLDLYANNATQCQFSNDGSTWSTWEAYATTKQNYSLASGDGLKTVFYRCKDATGNVSSAVFDVIILDTAAPGAPGSLSAAIVNEGIKLTWTAASDATSGVAYYNIYRDTTSGFTPSASNRIASGVTQTEFVDYPADGTYYYKVTAVDNAGQEGSASTEASATLDTTAPVDLAVTINNDATYTSSAGVTLTLYANNATQCAFSNDGSTWSAYESYTTTKSWNLDDTSDGLKTVFYRCKDATGNVSSAVFDTIVLDTAAPDPVTNLTAAQNGLAVQLAWSAATDATSGVDYYNVYRSTVSGFTPGPANLIISGLKDTNYQDYPPSAEGTFYYKVLAVDKAGNIATSSPEANVNYDIAAPSNLSITINGGDLYTRDTNVTLALIADDATYCQFRNEAGTWSSWQAYSTTATWNLSAGEGLKTVYYRCKDSQGNISDGVYDTIILDLTPPSTPTPQIPTTITTINSRAYTWNWESSTDSISGIKWYEVMLYEGSTLVKHDWTLANYYTFADLNDGSDYTLIVVAYDNADNNSSELVFPVVSVDVNGPSILAVDVPSSDRYYGALTPLFRFTVSPDTTQCEINLYINGAWQGVFDGNVTSDKCEWSVPAGMLNVDDKVRVDVRVGDAAGNWSNTIWSPTYTIDTSWPTITITSPASGSTTDDNTPTVSFTVKDNQGIMVISVTGVTGFNIHDHCTIERTTTGVAFKCSFEPTSQLADGNHTITIQTYDVANNTDTETTTFTVDTTDYIRLDALVAKQTQGIADDNYDNGWIYDFNITVGTGLNNDKNKIRFKMDDWTSGTSYTIAVNDNAKIVYDANVNGTKVQKTYYVKNTYDLTQTVYPLWDYNTSKPGIQAHFTLYQKIPVSTVAGTYTTTYYIKNYSS